jgi:two-component system CheB/CheR fusion protein
VVPIAVGKRPEPRVSSATERNLTKTAAVDGVRRAVLETFDAVFLNLPVGLVVIDRAYDIQHINTEARTLLGIYGPAIGDDFVHLANRLPSRELRATIDKAFREEGVARLAEIRIGNPGPAPSRHYIDLTCSPHTAAQGEPELMSILISDVTDRVVSRQKHDEEMAEQRQRLEATVSTLAAEVQLLTEANTEVLTANEELTSVNMQLRTANEEALIWTEQAVASSDAVETLNEEFQASNEELETVNEELQATVEELTTRSDQLAQMATARDEQWRAAEQARQDLELAFTAIPAAVLVVDSHGKPALSNQRYADIFGAADAEFRAEDRDGRPLTRGDSPQARAAQGESFEMEFTVRLDGHRRSFQASGSPLPSQSKGVLGRGLILIREAGFETDWEGRFPAT